MNNSVATDECVFVVCDCHVVAYVFLITIYFIINQIFNYQNRPFITLCKYILFFNKQLLINHSATILLFVVIIGGSNIVLQKGIMAFYKIKEKKKK